MSAARGRSRRSARARSTSGDGHALMPYTNADPTTPGAIGVASVSDRRGRCLVLATCRPWKERLPLACEASLDGLRTVASDVVAADITWRRGVRRWPNREMVGINSESVTDVVLGKHRGVYGRRSRSGPSRRSLGSDVPRHRCRRQRIRSAPTAHGARAGNAHDMAREYKTISGVARGGGVPVPPAVGLCEDASVNEGAFYIMGFVAGVVLDTAEAFPVHCAGRSART